MKSTLFWFDKIDMMPPTGIKSMVCQVILVIFVIYGLYFVPSCHCIKLLSSVDITKYHGLKGFMTHPYNQSVTLFLSDVCDGRDTYFNVTLKNEPVKNSIVTLSDLEFNETDRKNMSYIKKKYSITFGSVCYLQSIVGFHYDGNKAKDVNHESHNDEDNYENNVYSILRSVQHGYRDETDQDLYIYRGFFDEQVYRLQRRDCIDGRLDPFHVNTKTGKLYFVSDSRENSKLFCLDLNLCLLHGMCEPYEIRTGNEEYNGYITSMTLDETHNIIFLLYSNFVIEWIDAETMLPIDSYAESENVEHYSAISIDPVDGILYVLMTPYQIFDRSTIYAYKISYMQKTLTKISKRTFARILTWSYNPFLKSFYAIVKDYESDGVTGFENGKIMLSHFSMYNDLPPLNITSISCRDYDRVVRFNDYTDLHVNTNPNSEHFGCAYYTRFFPENGTTYLQTYC